MVEVKCYFVNYGISSYLPPGSQARLFLGTEGRDQDVPELLELPVSDDIPYDPFTIGNILCQSFCYVCL